MKFLINASNFSSTQEVVGIWETYMKKNSFQLISEVWKLFTRVQLIEKLCIFISSSASKYKLLLLESDLIS